jgi:hypothetical protein
MNVSPAHQRARKRQPALGLLHHRSASTALQPFLMLLARQPSKEVARWGWPDWPPPEGFGTDALFLWASAEAVNNRTKESAANSLFIVTSCAQKQCGRRQAVVCHAGPDPGDEELARRAQARTVDQCPSAPPTPAGSLTLHRSLSSITWSSETAAVMRARSPHSPFHGCSLKRLQRLPGGRGGADLS